MGVANNTPELFSGENPGLLSYVRKRPEIAHLQDNCSSDSGRRIQFYHPPTTL